MAMRRAKSQAEQSSEMLEALKHVSDEKGIPVEALVASIEGALVSAYKKAFGGTGAVRIVANFETSEFDVYAQKRVVQRALNPNVEIAWREAQAEKQSKQRLARLARRLREKSRKLRQERLLSIADHPAQLVVLPAVDEIETG